MITTTMSFKPITPRVRAGKWGKHIMCPNCKSVSKVYHFSWSAISCQHCHTDIDKLHWSVEQR